MEKLNVSVENGVKTLEIRTGEASRIYEPSGIKITGDISAVSRFLEKRMHTIDEDLTRVESDVENGTLKLIFNEDCQDQSSVFGSLLFTKEIQELNINGGEYKSAEELSEFLKMRRHLFANQSDALKIISGLKNIRVKVDRDLESSNDNRGTAKKLIAQKVIESNIPDKFTMSVAVYKGMPKVCFPVEIYIDPTTFECSMVSAELQTIIDTSKEEIIESELVKINELNENIVIIKK